MENRNVEINPRVEGELELELVLNPQPGLEYPRQADAYVPYQVQGAGHQQRDPPPLRPVWADIQNVLTEVDRRAVRAQQLAENNPTFARYQINFASMQPNPEEEAMVMQIFYDLNESTALLQRLREEAERELIQIRNRNGNHHHHRQQPQSSQPDGE